MHSLSEQSELMGYSFSLHKKVMGEIRTGNAQILLRAGLVTSRQTEDVIHIFCS